MTALRNAGLGQMLSSRMEQDKFVKCTNIDGALQASQELKGHGNKYIVKRLDDQIVKLDNPLAKKLRYHVIG